MRRVPVLAIAVWLVLLSACGPFRSSDTSSSETTEPGEVGASLRVPTTPAPVVATTRPGVATTRAVDPCTQKRTTSSVTHDKRIRLALTVSRACAALKDDIGLSLVVTNTSSQVIHYDPNQITVFTIRAPQGQQKRRWEDDDCLRATGDGQKRALDLAPGASITLATTYPAPRDVATRESCRRLETGDYEVHALFLVCDESYQDGYCEIAKDTQYLADPIAITLSP